MPADQQLRSLRAGLATSTARRTLSPRANAGIAVAGSVAAAVAIQLGLFASGIASARILGPTDRGILAQIVLAVSIVTTLGVLGLPLAVTFRVARDAELRPGLARTIVGWLVRQSVVLAPLTFLAAVLLCGLDSTLIQSLAIGAAVAPVLITARYGTAVMQGLHRYSRLSVLRAGPPVIYGTGAVLLLVSGTGSLVTLTLAWFAANAIVAAIAIRPVLAGARTQAPREPSEPLVRFGLRAFVGSVSFVDTLRLDQLVVATLFIPAVLGQYVVAVAFSNWPRFIGESVGFIAFPRLSAIEDPTTARRAIWNWTIRGALLGIGSGLILMALLEPLIVVLFGEAFRPSIGIAQVLVVGGTISGVRRLMTESARGAGFATSTSLAEGVSVISFLILVALLAPTAEEHGVAAAVAAGSLVGLLTLTGSIVLAGRRLR